MPIPEIITRCVLCSVTTKSSFHQARRQKFIAPTNGFWFYRGIVFLMHKNAFMQQMSDLMSRCLSQKMETCPGIQIQQVFEFFCFHYRVLYFLGRVSFHLFSCQIIFYNLILLNYIFEFLCIRFKILKDSIIDLKNCFATRNIKWRFNFFLTLNFLFDFSELKNS